VSDDEGAVNSHSHSTLSTPEKFLKKNQENFSKVTELKNSGSGLDKESIDGASQKDSMMK
jgi:hypothetical protein